MAVTGLIMEQKAFVADYLAEFVCLFAALCHCCDYFGLSNEAVAKQYPCLTVQYYA